MEVVHVPSSRKIRFDEGILDEKTARGYINDYRESNGLCDVDDVGVVTKLIWESAMPNDEANRSIIRSLYQSANGPSYAYNELFRREYDAHRDGPDLKRVQSLLCKSLRPGAYVGPPNECKKKEIVRILEEVKHIAPEFARNKLDSIKNEGTYPSVRGIANAVAREWDKCNEEQKRKSLDILADISLTFGNEIKMSASEKIAFIDMLKSLTGCSDKVPD